jgi:hypothetical protein
MVRIWMVLLVDIFSKHRREVWLIDGSCKIGKAAGIIAL